MVLLFASVLVHELAHGLMARARGQQPREFVLTLWGGHTAFGGVSPTPADAAPHRRRRPDRQPRARAGFFAFLRSARRARTAWSGCCSGPGAVSNAFVGLFNLIPGLPLDGGWVLEAAVWAVTKNRHTGTVVGRLGGSRRRRRRARVGARACRSCSGRQPEISDVVWAALIGAFLWSGASVGGARRPHAEGRPAASPLASVGRRAVGVGHTDSLAHAGAVAAAAGAEEVVILSPDGRPAAYVDRAAAASVPADAAGTTPVTAVAIPLPGGAVVDGLLSGPAARRPPIGRGHPSTRRSWWRVVDGRVVGLIRAMDVVAAIRS